MVRRKKKVNRLPTSAKRITDSEGWTHVVKGAPPSQSSDAIISSLKNLSPDASLTPDEVAAQQARYSLYWTDSSCWRRLAETIANDIPFESVNLTQCICLGLGSVVNGRHSPRHQLAALTELHSLLRGRCPSLSQNIVFQDPAFTPSDVEYLESLGHVVVETPDAFKMVEASTFLFAPHLERGIYAAALRDNEVPAICVAGDVTAFIEQIRYTGDDAHARDEDVAVLQRFHAQMDSTSLSEYDRDPWWYYTKLFWRKPSSHEVNG